MSSPVCTITVARRRALVGDAEDFTATLDVDDEGETPDTAGIGATPAEAILSLLDAYRSTFEEWGSAPHYGTNATTCSHGVSLGEACENCNPRGD